MLVVFESEEQARSREADPERAEAVGLARELMAAAFAGAPEFTDLEVVAELPPEAGPRLAVMGNARGEATRRQIVAAARRLYLARGIDRVSLRDVADEAGVTYGLIHHHFAGQDALVAAVMAEAVAEFRAGMAEAGSPVDMLATFFRHPDMALLVAQLTMSGTPPSWDEFPVVQGTVALVETWEDDPERARILAAGVLAAAAGWVILEPFLRQAADLDGLDPDRITTELGHALARLIEYPT